MTWTATKVEMSFCALFVSGSEISWHHVVPFFFFFLRHQRRAGKRANTHLGTALSLPYFVPYMSPWTVSTVAALSARGVCYQVSSATSDRDLAEWKFQGDSVLCS